MHIEFNAAIHTASVVLQVAADGKITCACVACSAWKQFLTGNLPCGLSYYQYEVFNRDYIRALAQYVR